MLNGYSIVSVRTKINNRKSTMKTLLESAEKINMGNENKTQRVRRNNKGQGLKQVKGKI